MGNECDDAHLALGAVGDDIIVTTVDEAIEWSSLATVVSRRSFSGVGVCKLL
jgi:hypothetical protein